MLILSNEQALLAIGGTRFAMNMADTAFHSMAKKLTRAHVPFESRPENSWKWEEVIYHFEHLIDFAVVFKMHAYEISFRHIIGLLTQHRVKLHSFYREAYLEADIGRGIPRALINTTANPQNKETREIGIGGLYLDFRASYSNGINSSPDPVLLDPVQVTERYMSIYDGLYPYALIALSQIC